MVIIAKVKTLRNKSAPQTINITYTSREEINDYIWNYTRKKWGWSCFDEYWVKIYSFKNSTSN